MYTISKTFHFSASHQLDHLPNGHPCARLHGHNYVVVLELSGEIDERGFVVDYGDLRPFKVLLDNELDHRHLNDILSTYTTAENLACWLFNKASNLWPQVTAVKVSETSSTWATYQP